MTVYLSPVLESYRKQLETFEKHKKSVEKCITLKYYNIQQSNTRDYREMYYTDRWFYWKICVTTLMI